MPLTGNLRSLYHINPWLGTSPKLSSSITLYKGLDQARLNGSFNDSGDVVAWQQQLSNPPSDVPLDICGIEATRLVDVHYTTINLENVLKDLSALSRVPKSAPL
ncbi:hypothetical protein Egran_01798 [Elaphomyces granulatus]|uniref:Uncharacterized protein n=1 Tax=Elaphomyces granulatus TaxID=519963 RepID=A0A232M1Y2_9EURO|nr:hypothetical protein Egran_01798 [Elaphomyces granulatus]